MKPTFLTYTKPPLVSMIQVPTVAEGLCAIQDSLYDGADAFGIQLCCLQPDQRSADQLKTFFAACEDKPIYVTSYRSRYNADMTDAQRGELLLHAVDCGATLCDVMGDYFHPEPQELTFDPDAVAKQKDLIAAIHEKGGEVLMSSHLHTYFEPQQLLEYALEQEARGADVIKIVNFAKTEEQMMANLQAIPMLRKALKHPFLLLANGAYSKLIRQIGPALGVCMYLCMQRYTPVNSKEQPQLRAAKAIRDHMNFPIREERLK